MSNTRKAIYAIALGALAGSVVALMLIMLEQRLVLSALEAEIRDHLEASDAARTTQTRIDE